MNSATERYSRYFRFFRFILKYWNSDIFNYTENDLEKENGAGTDMHAPEELVEDLTRMGPTYIKLGQLLSTRPDMLPEPFLKALTSLQDDVEPVPFKEIKRLFQEETGEEIASAFTSFDSSPIASASIGQVHHAVLRTGQEVAVKVQRPEIKKRFIEDLDILMTLSEKAERISEDTRKFSIHDTIEELQYILLQELNYKKEAQNLKVLKKSMEEFTSLQVPAIFPQYCTQKVLTMEYIDGQKVTGLTSSQLKGIPKKKLVDDFVKGYLKQIIVDGLAHADPHPGNIHVSKKGKLVLMDMGMVARFDEKMKETILKLMIGLAANDGNQVAKVLLDMSVFEDQDADTATFKKLIVRKIQENQNNTAGDLQTGRSLLEINKIAAQQNIRLPVELISLGKILLNMDQIIAFLSPEHKLQKTVKNYVEHLMRHRMLDQIKTGNILQGLLESKELVENMPYRLNKITENLAHQKFKVKMDVIDERKFFLAFQKVANRITTGLIVAALILGAALVMRIPTSWTLFGYPGFAILLFIFAALIGFYLIYQILFKDKADNNP